MPAAKPTPRTADNHEAIPPISDAEWVVMTEFWRLGEATAKDVVQTLKGRQAWKPKTVQTLINRLVQKGALGFRQQGREYVYLPRVEEDRCVHEASRTFVDRVFGGKLAPLLACFLERQECTPAELEEMRKLLELQQKQLSQQNKPAPESQS